MIRHAHQLIIHFLFFNQVTVLIEDYSITKILQYVNVDNPGLRTYAFWILFSDSLRLGLLRGGPKQCYIVSMLSNH